ncbi:hypothetical protein D9M72_644510 [compost metagenome]
MSEAKLARCRTHAAGFGYCFEQAQLDETDFHSLASKCCIAPIGTTRPAEKLAIPLGDKTLFSTSIFIAQLQCDLAATDTRWRNHPR